MPEVSIDKQIYEQLKLLARAWELPEGAVVARLLKAFLNGGRSASTAREVPIHSTYDGTRTSALFDVATKGVVIQDGQLAGGRYDSPSGAAVAVVRLLNPSIRPERNGWNFWVVTETGETLASLRPPHRR